jgi:hypothetical protein
LIEKEATPATPLGLTAFFQQVGKIIFPNDWDETEAASILKRRAHKKDEEALHAAQTRGLEVDEKLSEQLLGGTIKLAVDLESLGKLIPPEYKDQETQNAPLMRKYLDDCKRLNQPIDFRKSPEGSSSFTDDQHEVFDSVATLIGYPTRSYYEIRIARIKPDCIDWSVGDITIERDAIDANWDLLKCNKEDITPKELNNLRAWILNPDAALSLFTHHEAPASNAIRAPHVKHNWDRICGLIWRCLAVEKTCSDKVATQTQLANTVTDVLEREKLPVPSYSQLMEAAKHVLDQYARSDIKGPFPVKFSRGRRAAPARGL